MTPDSNGILYLEETDPITPFQTTINALQAATSEAISEVKPVVIAGRLWSSSTQAIPSGTTTEVEFDNSDVDGGVTNVGNTLVVPRSGWYVLSGAARFGTGASSAARQVRIYVNGSGISIVQNEEVSNTSLNTTAIYRLSQNDAVSLQVFQNTGSSLNLSPLSRIPVLSLIYIGG